MEDFQICRIALGKRRYEGLWQEIGGLTFVWYGDAWDCARTLRQPPRRVAVMLLKRMVEKGRATAASGSSSRLFELLSPMPAAPETAHV